MVGALPLHPPALLCPLCTILMPLLVRLQERKGRYNERKTDQKKEVTRSFPHIQKRKTGRKGKGKVGNHLQTADNHLVSLGVGEDAEDLEEEVEDVEIEPESTHDVLRGEAHMSVKSERAWQVQRPHLVRRQLLLDLVGVIEDVAAENKAAEEGEDEIHRPAKGEENGDH
jgi:hypothetical protein